MNVNELSKELEQYEQKMSSLRSQMDSLYDQIKEPMLAAAASWMKAEIESKIKLNPEVVQSLGIEKLAKLKSKLSSVIDGLPAVIATEFQDRSKWPHHIEVKEIDYRSHPNESYLNKIFRNVISTLGGLLDEVGLLKEPTGYVSSWKRIGGNRFRYAINPGMPNTIGQDYNKLLAEYGSLSIKLADIRKKLSEGKAKEMWDKA